MAKLYPDYAPGEKVIIDWRKKDFMFACCDCHLVHRLRFTVRGSKIIMRVWRDNRATGQLRRRRGIPVV